jgi:hypothetical protein
MLICAARMQIFMLMLAITLSWQEPKPSDVFAVCCAPPASSGDHLFRSIAHKLQ